MLARDGQPTATIVIAATPTSVATLGAQELQYHLQKITGATLPIKNDGEKVEGPRVLVGPSAATTQLGLDESQFKDQEYLIRFLDNSVILVGKEQGTSYAVHDFLERFCDVRWYGPGESQMVLPKTATLAVQPREIRRAPAFAWRCVFPELEQLTMGRGLYNQPSEQDMNVFWLRLRAGGEAYACNHSLERYYDRFWKKNAKCPEVFVAAHPDWFAQGYSASELEAYGGQPPQLCYSSQGVADQVVADARKFFDGQGVEIGAEAAGNYFAVAPMDRGGRGGWCKCPACQSQIDQKRQTENSFDSNGSASDYWFAFVNKVAREVAKTHPDKYISTLAYAGYSYYPRKVRLEPNVSLQMCLHARNWWVPGMQQDELRWYRGWVSHEKGRPLYLWLYYLTPEWSPESKFNCFPGFYAHALGRQIKMFARDGIRGAFIEGVSDQVDTYVTTKLLDDPSLDVDALLEEFFTRYYGPAAKPMKRFYLCVEETFSNPANYSREVQKDRKKDFFQTEEIAWKYLGTEARMAKLGKLMDEATQLAVGEVEKQRVALFRKAIWDHMVEGRKQYLAKQPKKP
ncbi:MAG: hypothetical protein A2V98_07440 [Planctomycetes bacterium RBG_16_64_12]|nr:MAG: hypothetical protein A2V98_07440 [Planctomycetes bacterium RBG_16_64_12]